MNIRDKYVLYTDTDVMFMDEVAGGLKPLAPKYFAVAPEFTKDNYEEMNSGVMLMNLQNLRKKDSNFRRFMSKNLDF